MLCAIGDLHIDRMVSTIPESPKLVLGTLDNVYKSMKQKGVKDFVLMGDTFHTPYADEDAWYGLIDFFDSHTDVATHIIMGNHDMESVNRYSVKFFRKAMKKGWLNGKVYLKPEIVKLAGDKYFMCPHPYVTDAPKGVRYAFGHFAFDGAQADNGRVLHTDNKPKGRWVLGDFHTPQGGRGFDYVGSLCATTFAEGNKKRVLLIEEERLRSISIDPLLKLDRAHIRSVDQLKELDTSIYWSVSFEPELIGKVKLHDYPHIVRHTSPSKVSKAAKALIKSVQSSDPLQDLPLYLKDHKGLSDEDAIYAQKLLKRAKKNVSA